MYMVDPTSINNINMTNLWAKRACKMLGLLVFAYALLGLVFGWGLFNWNFSMLREGVNCHPSSRARQLYLQDLTDQGLYTRRIL